MEVKNQFEKKFENTVLCFRAKRPNVAGDSGSYQPKQDGDIHENVNNNVSSELFFLSLSYFKMIIVSHPFTVF